ncbi:MAG: SHOCT domain-containing protein [Myxococcota bacterium]|nr:SHOCT domain-containing protein [Myxococcota bacterium]
MSRSSRPQRGERRPALRTAGLALLLLVALATGCARAVRTPVYDDNHVRVFLRHQTRGGEPVDRGFEHPVTIAPVRIVNILARIDVRGRKDDEGRRAAIPTSVIYAIGDGVSEALKAADSSQEIVVMAKDRRKTHYIFTNDYLTSMVIWVEGDRFFTHLGVLDEPLSRNPRDKVPEPWADDVRNEYRAVTTEGVVALGPQTVAAIWRDPAFGNLGAIRVRPGGRVVRRTILLESGEQALEGEMAGDEAPLIPPSSLSPEALRALADLEELRRNGDISEAEYHSQRRAIMVDDGQQ